MKKIFFSVCMLLLGCIALAQKPVIDTSIYNKWRGDAVLRGLSANGKYCAVETVDHNGTKTAIRSTLTAWKKNVIANIGRVSFASQDKQAIFRKGPDSLCILKLGSHLVEWICGVRSFKVSENGNAEWLLYQLKGDPKTLFARNLLNGKNWSYSNVKTYQFQPGVDHVLLQQEQGDGNMSLIIFDLDEHIGTPVWRGSSVERVVFNADGKAFAFTGTDQNGKKEIWYYQEGGNKVRMIEFGKVGDILVGTGFRFSKNGAQLLFDTRGKKDRSKLDPALTAVDIYCYKDIKLQSEQLNQVSGDTLRTYCYNLATHRLLLLTRNNEFWPDGNRTDAASNYILIGRNNGGGREEWNWNPSTFLSWWLVSTADGSRKFLWNDKLGLVKRPYFISAGNRYVIYYDAASNDFFSYNIGTSITKNITKGAGADWIDNDREDQPDSMNHVSWQTIWAKNDEAVFIRSKNDIYQADPSGQKPAIKLTGSNKEQHPLRFSFVNFSGKPEETIDLTKPLLLKVLDLETHDEGYCRIMPGRENTASNIKWLPYHLSNLTKARDAEVYALTMESAESAPNWYLTKDFTTYTQLTNVHPEKAWNWMSSELVHFKTMDGKATQGVLFKPENFDPNKKYPIIFTYYERIEDIGGLHQFQTPDPYDSDGGARINIPTYVSNGYLVFTMDIHYTVGHPGQSACNTIVGAANYLSHFPWVDQSHMGLMGHSFGGFETDYVISHSHLFAAAASMSPMTDFISAYGSIIGGGQSREGQYEHDRDRIGATLWERQDLYIENSPVLRADRVTTPVLLMANKKDGDVPYEQGVEFFTALRRLQKKAWMLQYDKGKHQVWDPTSAKDVTIRMQQFFDYYLKGKTPPKWMVQGIPAAMKQVDSGLEPDTTGGQP